MIAFLKTGRREKLGLAKSEPCLLDQMKNRLNDLKNCVDVLKNGGTILCDDYNLSYAPGVKKAIDEFVKENNYKCEILLNSRFAKIEKK